MQNKTLTRVWLHLLLGCLFMVFSGLAYRLTAKQLDVMANAPVLPKVAFSEFPYEFGQWRGTELPLSETVLDVANNEDYISRRYWNERGDMDVTFYLAYTSIPVNMDGHRPTVCYVGSGWLHEGTEEVELEPLVGSAVTVLIHKFRKPMSSFPDISVLNYYIVSGQATTDYKAFSGLKYRRIVRDRKQPRYVAQVQISSTSPTAPVEFARQIVPMIWHYMPELEVSEE